MNTLLNRVTRRLTAGPFEKAIAAFQEWTPHAFEERVLTLSTEARHVLIRDAMEEIAEADAGKHEISPERRELLTRFVATITKTLAST